MRYRANVVTLLLLATLSVRLIAQVPTPPFQQHETLLIDAKAASTPFPHFWEKTFGSGRAILSLRESYRTDLRTVKAATDFESIRFHGIFLDEVGLYDPDRETQNPGEAAETAQDPSVYNFSYINQIYDGLLANHVKPFVELSFMPKLMSSSLEVMPNFWYHPNVSPPKDYKAWDAMVTAFATHLIARYGIDEVATWNFEVWNEPNLEFWAGNPKQQTYFELYDHTARALKAASPRLRVGGPVTARAEWVVPFLQHVKEHNVPVDFVSTHIYANDEIEAVFGKKEDIPREEVVYRAVKMVHEQIASSPYPHLPFILSEFNVSWRNDPNILDSPYMGPWLANTIRLCDGLVDNMAYWDFSDVFEEQGVTREPFSGGYGLNAANNIPKASLNVFAALHQLGDRRLANPSTSALVTLGKNGVAIALWNYAPPRATGKTYVLPSGTAGPAKEFDLEIKNVPSSASVQIFRIDDDHSNVLKTFDAMGRPPGDLTQVQIHLLQQAGQMSPVESVHLDSGRLHITVPAHGLAVLLVK
jgi:xylan 1,4-beta-xylosidase